MDNPKKVLVLFSGGKDSSATAIEMARAGYVAHLYTYQAGMPELSGPRGESAPDIRHQELLNVFPEKIKKERILEGSMYLIRKLGIEKTNALHVVYPLVLALAVHSNAIIYCIRNGIRDVACGYSGYQAKEDRYIEQRDDFFELMKAFLEEYGITYHAPIIKRSKVEVIDILEKFGVSSNSLENKSVFGGIDFEVDKALDFWNTSLPFCKEYISEILRGPYILK